MIQLIKKDKTFQLKLIAGILIFLSFLIPNIIWLNTQKITSSDQYIQFNGIVDTIYISQSPGAWLRKKDNFLNIKLQEFPKPFAIPPIAYAGANTILILNKISPGDSIDLDIVLTHNQPQSKYAYEVDLLTGKEDGSICGIHSHGKEYFSPKDYNIGQRKNKRKSIVFGLFITGLILLRIFPSFTPNKKIQT